MSNTDTIVILIAFAAYLMLMIVIGAIYMKNTNNSEDYFLGGRGLSGWVAALSAQASDMSGWLLMGLPGVAYLTGIADAGWTAIGLAIGTWLNWFFVPYTASGVTENIMKDCLHIDMDEKKSVLGARVTIIVIALISIIILHCGDKSFDQSS